MSSLPPQTPSQGEVDQLIALFNAKNYVELETQAQAMVTRYPTSGRAWKILGTALGVQGKNALPPLQKAVELLPDDAAIHNNLGNAWQDLHDYESAAACYRKALEIAPDFSVAYTNLGKALSNLGQVEEALINYQRALVLDPGNTDAYYNQGNALRSLGQFERAVSSYQQGLALDPADAQMHYNLGCVLEELYQPGKARDAYRQAISLNPNFVEAHNNLGNSLKEIAEFDAAVSCYRRALAIQPEHADAYSNLLFVLNYAVNSNPVSNREEARAYGRMVALKRRQSFTSWQCNGASEILRIGIVSGDLYNHPVGFFLESLVKNLDQTRFELFVYPTVQKEDELTKRIKACLRAWQPLNGMSDEAAAQLIHDDGVHILLDLSGHTGYNRLPVFAWKPAPIQASWLGYFGTTGVAEIDYILADKTGVPTERQDQFTERVWYLPDTRLCFTPPTHDIPIAPLPVLSRGKIIFGCFQTLAKINDEVLAVWQQIMQTLPQATLRITNKQLQEPYVQERFKQRLLLKGIDPRRVELQGALTRAAYLAAHNEVDVILDTFPYPGGTTTCEALWMGVPTLTLAGNTLLARQGASVLHAAGLDDWIVDSHEAYIQNAVAYASDLPMLAALRAGLRTQVLASPLCDAPRFAKNFEEALGGMWRTWCEKS